MELAANRTQTFHQVKKIILYPTKKIMVTDSYARTIEIKIEEGENLSVSRITLFAISPDSLQIKKGDD